VAETEKQNEGGEESHGGGGHSGGHGGGHGGGGHEEHEGAPEWLISFADNVALMMGFFVILLAMNMAKKTAGGIGGEEKMGGSPQDIDFVLAIRQAFNPIDMDSTNPAEAPLRKRLREKASEGERSRQPEDPGKGKESNAIRPTDLSTLGGTIEFDDNSTTLSSKGQARVEEIAQKIKGLRFFIEVRGHASPSETYRQAEKGMALGYARALTVARVLAAQGVPWEQVRLVACGDNERTVGRVYDDSDRLNQRVNIVPTNEPAQDYSQPQSDDKAPDRPKDQAAARHE